MKKKVLHLMVALLLLIAGSTSINAQGRGDMTYERQAEAQGVYVGIYPNGNWVGTPNNDGSSWDKAILISNATQWAGITSGTSTNHKYYKLIDNIVCNGYITAGNLSYTHIDGQWYTISTQGSRFANSLTDCEIKNLNINLTANTQGAAVAIDATGGKFTDIRVFTSGASTVSPANNVGTGALLGAATSAEITNCRASINIAMGDIPNGGGLIGTASTCTIKECFASGNVTGGLASTTNGTNYGGLIGTLNGGTVEDCFAYGNITSAVRWYNAAGTAGGGWDIHTATGYDGHDDDDDKTNDTGCNTSTCYTHTISVASPNKAGIPANNSNAAGIVTVGNAQATQKPAGITTGTFAIDDNSNYTAYYYSPKQTPANLGGLIGYSTGQVERCYAAGDVNATHISPEALPHNFYAVDWSAVAPTGASITFNGTKNTISAIKSGNDNCDHWTMCGTPTPTCSCNTGITPGWSVSASADFIDYDAMDFRRHRAAYVGGLIGHVAGGSQSGNYVAGSTITGDNGYDGEEMQHANDGVYKPGTLTPPTRTLNTTMRSNNPGVGPDITGTIWTGLTTIWSVPSTDWYSIASMYTAAFTSFNFNTTTSAWIRNSSNSLPLLKASLINRIGQRYYYQDILCSKTDWGDTDGPNNAGSFGFKNDTIDKASSVWPNEGGMSGAGFKFTGSLDIHNAKFFPIVPGNKLVYIYQYLDSARGEQNKDIGLGSPIYDATGIRSDKKLVQMSLRDNVLGTDIGSGLWYNRPDTINGASTGRGVDPFASYTGKGRDNYMYVRVGAVGFTSISGQIAYDSIYGAQNFLVATIRPRPTVEWKGIYDPVDAWSSVVGGSHSWANVLNDIYNNTVCYDYRDMDIKHRFDQAAGFGGYDHRNTMYDSAYFKVEVTGKRPVTYYYDRQYTYNGGKKSGPYAQTLIGATASGDNTVLAADRVQVNPKGTGDGTGRSKTLNTTDMSIPGTDSQFDGGGVGNYQFPFPKDNSTYYFMNVVSVLPFSVDSTAIIGGSQPAYTGYNTILDFPYVGTAPGDAHKYSSKYEANAFRTSDANECISEITKGLHSGYPATYHDKYGKVSTKTSPTISESYDEPGGTGTAADIVLGPDQGYQYAYAPYETTHELPGVSGKPYEDLLTTTNFTEDERTVSNRINQQVGDKSVPYDVVIKSPLPIMDPPFKTWNKEYANHPGYIHNDTVLCEGEEFPEMNFWNPNINNYVQANLYHNSDLNTNWPGVYPAGTPMPFSTGGTGTAPQKQAGMNFNWRWVGSNGNAGEELFTHIPVDDTTSVFAPWSSKYALWRNNTKQMVGNTYIPGYPLSREKGGTRSPYFDFTFVNYKQDWDSIAAIRKNGTAGIQNDWLLNIMTLSEANAKFGGVDYGLNKIETFTTNNDYELYEISDVLRRDTLEQYKNVDKWLKLIYPNNLDASNKVGPDGNTIGANRDTVSRTFIRVTPYFVTYKDGSVNGGKPSQIGVCAAKSRNYGYRDTEDEISDPNYPGEWDYRGVTDFAITVNPRPILFPIKDVEVCNQDSVEEIIFRTHIRNDQSAKFSYPVKNPSKVNPFYLLYDSTYLSQYMINTGYTTADATTMFNKNGFFGIADTVWYSLYNRHTDLGIQESDSISPHITGGIKTLPGWDKTQQVPANGLWPNLLPQPSTPPYFAYFGQRSGDPQWNTRDTVTFFDTQVFQPQRYQFSRWYGNDRIYKYKAINWYRFVQWDTIDIQTYFINRNVDPNERGEDYASKWIHPESPYVSTLRSECKGTYHQHYITIYPTTTIDTHPTGGAFCSETSHKLHAEAHGTDLKYQWYFNPYRDKNGTCTKYEPIPGAVYPDYVATANGWYFLKVVSHCEDQYSDTVRLDLNIPPIFYTNADNCGNVVFPDSVSICEGSDFTYRVSSDGQKYDWYRDGIHLLNNDLPTLALTNVNFEDWSVYSVKATNVCNLSTEIKSRFWAADSIRIADKVIRNMPTLAEENVVYEPTVGAVYGFDDITWYTWSYDAANVANFETQQGAKLQTTRVKFTDPGDHHLNGTLQLKAMHVCGDNRPQTGGFILDDNKTWYYIFQLPIEFQNDITGIDPISAKMISIYPNPVSNELNIRANAAIKSVKVTDVNGRTIYTQDGIDATTLSIPANAWTRGTYLISVTTIENSGVYKVVKK